jgi:hypothetical protein
VILDEDDYGFICGDFWVAAATDGTILPDSFGEIILD